MESVHEKPFPLYEELTLHLLDGVYWFSYERRAKTPYVPKRRWELKNQCLAAALLYIARVDPAPIVELLKRR